jgi:hypothetical protein
MFTMPVIIAALISAIGFLLNCGMLYLVLSKGRQTYHYLFSAVLFICALWDFGILLSMLRNNHENELTIYGYVVFLPCSFLAVLIYQFTTTYLRRPKKKRPSFYGSSAPLGLSRSRLDWVEKSMVFSITVGEIFIDRIEHFNFFLCFPSHFGGLQPFPPPGCFFRSPKERGFA